MLYPMKFKKFFVEKVWGGREFETKLGMKLPEGKKLVNLGKCRHIRMEWVFWKMALWLEKDWTIFTRNIKVNL